MTPEQSAALREEFKPEQIGKLPKVNCRACVEANKREFGTTCTKHHKIECTVCKAWITEKHIHLDFVGHAVATDRLLEVDPGWTWEPFALDVDGLPKMRGNDLWIRLTVAGVTRPGVGDGPTAKEAISDAIRNAAMRFGVALSLWAKGELHPDQSSGPEPRLAQSPDASGSEPSVEAPRPSTPAGGSVAVSPPGAGPPAPDPTKVRPTPPGPVHFNPGGASLEKAISRASALRAIGVDIRKERDLRKLPELRKVTDERQWKDWQALLDLLEARADREADRAVKA